MEQESVDPKGSNAVKHPSLKSKQLETITGKAAHTYELWKQTSSAECAAIVARAKELMSLISGRGLRE